MKRAAVLALCVIWIVAWCAPPVIAAYCDANFLGLACLFSFAGMCTLREIMHPELHNS